MRRPLLSVFLTFALLAACSAYEPPDPGLIANPGFADESDAMALGEPWLAAQHAGEQSYETRVSDGVLYIERIGSEPWGKTIQEVPADELKGRRAEFSVELAGTLEPVEDPSGIRDTLKGHRDTGLGVVVKGYRDDPRLRRLLGKSTLVTAESKSGMEPGEHDWQRHRLAFDVPENATEIVVEIRMTLNGVLKARGPRLVAVEDEEG